MKQIFSQRWYIYIGLVGSVVLLLIIGGLVMLSHKQQVELPEALAIYEEVPEESQETEEEGPIFVDIKGAVQFPGVYQLPCGSRMIDLLELAGGLEADAYSLNINQAQVLHDQDLHIVYTLEEIEAAELELNSLVVEGEPSSNLININQADQTELETLPGIGPKKAQAIIAYREEIGFFPTCDALMEVSGIGQKTFEALEELIAVGP